MCCTRGSLKYRTQKYAKTGHLRTIPQICRDISSQLKHVSTIEKKLVKRQYLLRMCSQHSELRPTNGRDRLAGLGHPSKFPRGSRQNTEKVILQRDITKENCIRCIIASSKWTMVTMWLKFTYIGRYTAKPAWNKDSWHQWPATTLDVNLFWLWPDHHRCWRDHLRSCVPADGGHFEHMLWHESSLIWFIGTFLTVNVIWCM